MSGHHRACAVHALLRWAHARGGGAIPEWLQSVTRSLEANCVVEKVASKVEAAMEGLSTAISQKSFETKFSYVSLACCMLEARILADICGTVNCYSSRFIIFASVSWFYLIIFVILKFNPFNDHPLCQDTILRLMGIDGLPCNAFLCRMRRVPSTA